MFGWLKGKQPQQPTPRVHVVEVHTPRINIKKETGSRLRQGMWVMVGGSRLGILKEMNEFGVCQVMLVDEHGYNLLEMAVPAGELTQAKKTQLPVARVGHMTGDHLDRLGYKE